MKKKENEEFKKTKKKHKIIFLSVIGIIIIWIGVLWSDWWTSMNDPISICTFSQIEVKNLLKSPTSAKFPVCSYSSFSSSGWEYYYEHYLDAKNSYGAEIRTKFRCMVRDLNPQEGSYNIKCSLLD